MIIFHPEVHLPQYQEKVEGLQKRAIEGEFVLMLESQQHDPQSTYPILGFENMETLPISVLCSTYQMSQVPYITLQEGGTHSIAVLVFFLLLTLWYPAVRAYTEKYSDRSWYEAFSHFLQDITFDPMDYDNSSENMKTHIRKRSPLRGGLPAQVPYAFIQDTCFHVLNTLFPECSLDKLVVQKTLIEREEHMSKHILHAANRFDKDIHVCIGAGHLMPFLSQEQIESLGLAPFFTDYHREIKENRLLHYISDFEIQLL